jgi:hypothetical protein
MFWTGILIGLFVGTFVGLFLCGLLTASSKSDDLLFVVYTPEKAVKPPSLTSKLQQS